MNLQVLVVDDDEVAILIHKTILKKCDLSVPLTFSDGLQLVDYLFRNKEANDKFLIFLDINMPEMNAWEFLDTIKPICEKTFVVIITSSINKRDKEKAMLYKNIITFLEKPMRIQDCEQIKTIPAIAEYFKK